MTFHFKNYKEHCVRPVLDDGFMVGHFGGSMQTAGSDLIQVDWVWLCDEIRSNGYVTGYHTGQPAPHKKKKKVKGGVSHVYSPADHEGPNYK